MNMMAETTAPFTLEIGTLYYVAGRGILEFRGETDKRHNKALAKEFKNANVIYRFKPHSVFSEELREIPIADTAVKTGFKVHPLPSAAELEKALGLVRGKRHGGDAQDSDHRSVAFQIESLGILNIGKIIRDYKKYQNDPYLPKARLMLSQVLAHHLGGQPIEATDYINVLMHIADFPDELTHLPKNRAAMIAIAKEYKQHRTLSPEFVAGLGKIEAVSHQYIDGAIRKTVPSSRIDPHLSVEQSILTHLGRATSVIPTEREDAPLEDAVKEIAPKPSPTKLLLSMPPSPSPLPETSPKEASPSHPMKGLSSKGVDRSVVLTQHLPLYADLQKSFAGTPDLKLVDAGLNVITQGDALDLSRLLCAGDHFALGNVYITKEKLEPGHWSIPKVRASYQYLLNNLSSRLSDEDKIALAQRLDGLHKKLAVKVEQAPRHNIDVTLAFIKTTQSSQSDASPAQLPVAPNSSVTATSEKTETRVPDEPQEHHNAVAVEVKEENITDRFPILNMNNGRVSPMVLHDLSRTIDGGPPSAIRVQAARELSTIAYTIFVGHAFDGTPVEQLARDIGTKPETICQIFDRARRAVVESLINIAQGLEDHPAPQDCHKNTLG